jgi:hypothetical protein
MRNYPTTEDGQIDEDDQKELNALKADDWQLDLLKKNPEYTSWGCYEDSMSNESGWSGRIITPTWKEHKWDLNELNELINFYFEVYRKNHECPECEGSGQNKATKQLADDWYDFAYTGRKWHDKITDVEVLALAKAGRLHHFSMDRFYFDEDTNNWMEWKDGKRVALSTMPKLPTAEEVNNQEKRGGFGGHDAINRWVCIEARAKHLGIWGKCEHCESGVIYDEPKASVALQLWYIHPRKGASRGVYIESLEQEDVPEILAYLKEARDRNNERFSKI